ncbi:MAG: T9SS type A sorting domain-containing protein, partial [Ignavibacteriaceae bacterium]|nr:T9SS type A sorting domain-containing protein [Ignavibacteriaceae bacterium]
DYYIDSRNIPGGFKEHVTCFDVNSDGYDDILVNKIYIFKGGVKLDTLPSYYVAPPNNDTSNFGQYPWAGGGGDFNKDSVKDVLLSSTQGVFGVVAGAFVMLGDKAYPGQYVAYRIFSDYWWKAPLYGRPENAGDVNGDGVDDIIIGSALEFTKNEGFFGIYSGDTTLVTEVKNQSTSQPNSFELKQNYPNPFNPETTINYTLPESGIVQIKIFDVLGRELKTLVNEFSGSGLHSVKWDGSNYSSGIYFCSITFNGKTLNNKMLLMK